MANNIAAALNNNNNNNNNTTKKAKVNTVNLTQEELQSLITAAVTAALAAQTATAPVAAAPAAPVVKQATKRENTLSYRFMGMVTDKVLVPTETFARDKAVPQTLMATAVAAGKAGNWLDRLAESAGKKGFSLMTAEDQQAFASKMAAKN